MTTALAFSTGGNCFIGQYVRGWRLGTGLPVSLKPGSYRMTGQDRVNNVVFYQLQDKYHVDSRLISR